MPKNIRRQLSPTPPHLLLLPLTTTQTPHVESLDGEGHVVRDHEDPDEVMDLDTLSHEEISLPGGPREGVGEDMDDMDQGEETRGL